MSGRLSLAWRGRRRSLARAAVLFAVTAGGYWPVWLVQVAPSGRPGPQATRGRIALGAAAVLPGINVALEVLLALVLPRTVRALAERRGKPVSDTEAQTFLLLAAPSAAIAIALGFGLPWWLVGYIAWPLELPATLVVQRALNQVEEAPAALRRRYDGEVLAAGALAVAGAIALVVALVAGGDGDDKQPVPGAGQPQEARVSDLAATPTAGLWITRIQDNQLEQVDRTTLRPTGRRVPVGRSPYDVASGFGSLWVADYRSDAVSRVDPRTARAIGRPIPTGRGPFGVAVGFGRVWVTNEVDRNLVEINPATNRVRRKITVGLGPRGVAVGEGAVWVAGSTSLKVVRVDPRTRAKRDIPMPDLCQDVAVGGGSVWAAIPQANSVVRIDPEKGRRAGGLISVGLGPASVAYGAGAVWVANTDGTVTQINPRTGRVVGKPRLVGSRLTDITVSGRTVLVLREDGVVRRITAR